jgi:hypothetical protein
MKRKLFICLGIVAFFGLTAMYFPGNNVNSDGSFQGEVVKPELPDSVLTIVERSCFDCHSDNSGNFAAKGKLNFSGWNEYTPVKKVSKMEAICEVITKGKMPKKKYVSKNPDKALTKAEIDLICNWANEESKKLVGE